jgi:hypothetical protein
MTESASLDSTVRHAINLHAIHTGFAPDVKTLADSLKRPFEEIERSLDRLAGNRGLVLHPGSHRIWIAHPFSFAPTAFWVTSARGSWWGNCAWCSLGIAAMLEEDATVVTRAGGEAATLEVAVRDGAVQQSELLVHFAVPAAKWWDNVHYTCATILFFRAVTEIDGWCRRHAIPRGEILSSEQVWALAQAWYGDYLNPNWRRRTIEEARGVFRELGLTSRFWEFPP